MAGRGVSAKTPGKKEGSAKQALSIRARRRAALGTVGKH